MLRKTFGGWGFAPRGSSYRLYTSSYLRGGEGKWMESKRLRKGRKRKGEEQWDGRRGWNYGTPAVKI